MVMVQTTTVMGDMNMVEPLGRLHLIQQNHPPLERLVLQSCIIMYIVMGLEVQLAQVVEVQQALQLKGEMDNSQYFRTII